MVLSAGSEDRGMRSRGNPRVFDDFVLDSGRGDITIACTYLLVREEDAQSEVVR